MKPILTTAIIKLLALGCAAAQTLTAATVVDWLELAPDAQPEAFQLADDDGVPRVSGALTISTGIPFPGLPAARELGGGFWDSSIDLLDSRSGDEKVAGFGIRVVPSGGVASYRLDLALPPDQPLVLAIGGLFADAAAATDAAALSYATDLGSGIPQLRSMTPWDDGATSFSEALDWDAGGGILSTRSDSDGESRIAFFEIPALSGGNPSLRIDVPDGFGNGVGDELFIAFAAVPEPSGLTLVLLGSGLLLRRRAR